MNAQNLTKPLTPFEQDHNYSSSYEETIAFYKELETQHETFVLQEIGSTDSGKPLHLAVLSMDGDFDPKSNQQKDRTVLFVNNAIHPGEPCGVDASMMLFRDILFSDALQAKLKNTVLISIPFYNIGGGLNRSAYSRVNQNGPANYGFRGNAKNLDLNRDFIKCDSENAKSFNQIFSIWDPHVFIDNHTSNGADYQYTMTLIATQKDKLAAPLSKLMTEEMIPFLYKDMKERHWEMTPYVYSRGIPDHGIYGFNETPRYSTGYTTLHHAIGFMPETHMLKPFKDRVMSVHAFLLSMLDFVDKHSMALNNAKRESTNAYQQMGNIPIEWQLNPELKDSFLFKGYEAKYKPSDISGKDRLYYDQDEPFEKPIDYFNTYGVKNAVRKPSMYIIPQAYKSVIDRLNWNNVKLKQLESDTVFSCEMYRIKSFNTVDEAYESHYLHSQIELEILNKDWQFYAGDYIVETGQANDRYLVEVLEPHAPDSYFAWNFFDGILMQKEYFSSYVFEDLAAEIIADNPEIKEALEEKKSTDPEFANNARAQLDFIYRQSRHYEQTHRLYPIGRVFK